jgi:ribose 5-phosphate isomerase A
MNDSIVEMKRRSAEYAVGLIEDGMIVGLGTGSTAIWAVRHLAELRLRGSFKQVVGVATSQATETEARRRGIPLTTLEDHPDVDITIDGADEVDPAMNAIKGGGGALLREKIVAVASRRLVIIVDESKLSPQLGTRWPVPVEVVSFGWMQQLRFLETLGAAVTLRTAEGAPFLSDNGNLILDCNFGLIVDPAALSARLKMRTGILDHGLFPGMATDLVVADRHGIHHHTRPAASNPIGRK